MKSIKTKLILSFFILIFAITSVMGGMFLKTGYDALKKEAEKSLKLMAAEGAKLTESRMETLFASLEIIAKKREIIDMGWEVDLVTIKEELKKTTFLDIAYVLPTGYAYYTDGTVSLMSDRNYIKDALKGQKAMSDVVISRVTRKPEVEISVPIIKSGKVVGALIARNKADALSTLTEDEGYGEDGYAFIINEDGRVIAYPDIEKVTKLFNPITGVKKDPKLASLAKAYQIMLKKKSGVTSFVQNNNGFFAGYAQVKGTDWIFATTADQQEVFSALPGMVKTIIIVMVAVIILSFGIVYLLEMSITRPLIGITKLSKQFASLDFRENISEKYLKQKDEIGVMSQTFQTLTLHLREIISKINESANQVTATAQELTATSMQSAQIAEEISCTVENIAKGASEQASNTEIGSENAVRLGETIEMNQRQVTNLNVSTERVNELVNSGLLDVERLSLSTKENRKATEEICDIILQTKRSSEQISEASKMISDMAKQTNLLALNASIEAARAGEAGRGFSVVAEEIQKMADQSAVSTRYIDDIINTLLSNVKKSAESMNRITITSEEQQKSVVDTIQKYQAIAASMEISEAAVKKLNASEKEMGEAKDEILNLLESLSAIAEQNAAGTQQATSFVEEQTLSARELAVTSSRLSDLAVDLQLIIDRVQI